MKNSNKLTLLFLAVLLTGQINAKEIKYKVSDIPKELRENARSIVRNEEIVFEISSIKSAVMKVTYAITILNKNGLDDAEFNEGYDKFHKISGIKGHIFDENGESVKRLAGDDIIDHSAISGISIYEDNRVKYIDPKYRTIPFTVEYSYEISYDGLFDFPEWDPQPHYNFAVEKSSYKAIVPKGMVFRYLEQNVPTKVSISSDQKNDTYYWEAKNLKAIIYEPYSFRDLSPVVYTAPFDFEIEGYKGNLNSWENMGKWISVLNNGKDNLPDEAKKTIKDLVSNTDNDFEKIRKIYEYMQGKTRYISIQIGIGGWQPFDAATVNRLSYGDCKALTNYMKTLLEVAGIKSNYCLVHAGESAPFLYKEFPSTQFNHAFLCVPLKQDTIWLECTSQRLPCGFISDFTDDRDVLLIDNNESKIVHTKAYTAQENKETCTSHVTFESVGIGSAIIKTSYCGVKYDDGLRIMLADDVDKKKLIAADISLPSFDVQNYSFTDHRKIIPIIDEKVSVSFRSYGTQMGQRVFMPLNFVNRLTDIPERVRNRKTEVFVRRPSLEIDTVIYELPVNYKVESLPKSVDIQNQFGEYHAHAEAKDRQVIYFRSFLINKGKYSATTYTDFIDFFDKVSTADGLQCSLVKNL
ncbi:MAG TPA: DUF3857 domain-containing protein [Bacteroidales bacterium]